MKTKQLSVTLFLLVCFLFSSCKEDRLMRKQAGVWEIKTWQGTTYNNGVVATDTTVSNMGYLSLYDSGLNGQPGTLQTELFTSLLGTDCKQQHLTGSVRGLLLVGKRPQHPKPLCTDRYRGFR